MASVRENLYSVPHGGRIIDLQLTAFEPAFPFAEMEAFRSVRADMSPTAFLPVRTLKTLIPMNNCPVTPRCSKAYRSLTSYTELFSHCWRAMPIVQVLECNRASIYTDRP
jgi:hypothetical protein